MLPLNAPKSWVCLPVFFRLKNKDDDDHGEDDNLFCGMTLSLSFQCDDLLLNFKSLYGKTCRYFHSFRGLETE